MVIKKSAMKIVNSKINMPSRRFFLKFSSCFFVISQAITQAVSLVPFAVTVETTTAHLMEESPSSLIHSFFHSLFLVIKRTWLRASPSTSNVRFGS